jgi:exonuclease SbcD
MNLLILTDLHLTSNRYAGRIGDFTTDVDTKLEEVIQISKEIDAEAILCAGDTFHRPDVSYSTISRFINFLERIKCRFIVIPGSHDLFGNNLDALYRTALGLCERLNLIELLYPEIRPATRVGDITIGMQGKKVDIELLHSSILPNPDFGDYTLIKDYNTKAKLVIIGHYHRGYDICVKNGSKFICPGSLVRTSADKSELTRRPRVCIVNDNLEVEWRELKSAKPGIEVLLPSIVTQQLDFTDMSEWGHISKLENVDAVSLLTEIATNDKVPVDILKYALHFLEEQR